MEKFDINKIIAHYGISENIPELAKLFFPHVKYPKQAFDRVLKGEATLDVDQVQKLAEYLGVLAHELFNIDSWKGTSESGCLTFTKGEFKVKLNYNNVFLSLYKNNELIDTKISSIPAMSLNDFIQYIDELIKQY